MSDVLIKMLGSYPSLMAMQCICFPSVTKAFLVQALIMYKKVWLSIKEECFLGKLANNKRALVEELELR